MEDIEKRWTDTVKTKNKKLVWIDTCNTFDEGWETIVVRAGKNGEPLGSLQNWGNPLLMVHYGTEEEAAAGHKLTVAQFQGYELDKPKVKKNHIKVN